MTGRYNPNSPALAGAEWFGAAVTSHQPGNPGATGTTIASTATESIDQIIPWVTPTPLSGAPALQCDIYDLGTVPVGWPDVDLPDTRRYIKPVANSGATIPAGWQKNTSGSLTATDTNNWQQIDDLISDVDAVTVGNTDSLQYAFPTSAASSLSFKGGSSFLDATTGASASDLTGLRIAGIEVVVTAFAFTIHSVTLNAFLTLDGISYPYPAPDTLLPGVTARHRFIFNYDPRTGLPWTNSAAQTFVATASNFFGFTVQGPPGAGAVQVTAAALIFHTVPERRVATADAPVRPSPGWLPLTCRAVGTGSTSAWSKTTGHTYLVLFHVSQNMTGHLTIPAIDTTTVAGHEADTALFIGQDASGEPGAIPTHLRPTTNTNLAVLLGSTPSIDSQPYAATRVDEIGGPDNHVLRQHLTGVGATTYGTATILVQTTSSITAGVAAQDRDLSIIVRKTADDSTLAGPFLLPSSDVPPDGKWHTVTVRFAASVLLTAAEGVYLELSSVGSTVPWLAVGLLTRQPPVPATDPTSIAAAGVGIGTTTGGTVDGVDDQTLDYPWNIGTVPATPTGLAATIRTIANQPTLSGPAAIPTISYVALTWTRTSLGAAFGRYEIMRIENLSNSPTPVPIAYITSENSNFFNDFETPRDAAIIPAYLVRVVRNDGQPSDFDFVFAPATPPTSGPCDLVLASNFHPELTLAVQDETPYQTKTAEAAAVVIHRIYGRQFPVQFQPNGDGQGDIFARKLTIALNDPSVIGANAGRALFDPIVALTRAAVPYVVVCDGIGRRWFCGLTLGDVTRTEPGGDYSATVTFNEVANLPTPITTDIPWSP